MKYYIIGLMAVSLMIVSCQKEAIPAPDFSDKLLKIGQQNLSNGNTVTLYAADTLRVGYNELFLLITKSNTPVASSVVSISTLMDMGTMKHSSPSVAPVFNPDHKLYDAAAIFTMAAGSGSWSLNVNVDGEELSFVLNIKESKAVLVTTATGSDANVYVLSLFPQQGYKVGFNNFSLIIYKKENPVAYTPVTGLDIELNPEMTSMGHSSPNNVNPTDSGNGFYNGRVNFTMSGEWRLHFKIKAGSTLLFEDVYLDIIF